MESLHEKDVRQNDSYCQLSASSASKNTYHAHGRAQTHARPRTHGDNIYGIDALDALDALS